MKNIKIILVIIIKKILNNLLLIFWVIVICFVLSMGLQYITETGSLIPAIFVLGVFVISILTKSYIYGIISAVFSIVLINLSFSGPPVNLEFSPVESILCLLITIGISIVTCALTKQFMRQESVKTESENERMRANLLRAVSHDLRTPLTTIYGSSSAILENYEDFSDSQKLKMLTGIKEDSSYLVKMVENLLSITRLDSGHIKLAMHPTVLYELVDSTLNKFYKTYPDIDVKTKIPDQLVMIPMDALLIKQVIPNILENAVIHAKGMTKLSLKVFASDKKAIFEIKDNGCGISEERMKGLFKMFFTPENTLSDTNRTNAGIGLSVCAAIINAHGGKIWAKL